MHIIAQNCQSEECLPCLNCLHFRAVACNTVGLLLEGMKRSYTLAKSLLPVEIHLCFSF